MMEYRRLGASGLKVPALSFGAGTFGGAGPLFSAWGQTDTQEARRLVDISTRHWLRIAQQRLGHESHEGRELGRGVPAGRPKDVEGAEIANLSVETFLLSKGYAVIEEAERAISVPEAGEYWTGATLTVVDQLGPEKETTR
jgi:hypothetical protein